MRAAILIGVCLATWWAYQPSLSQNIIYEEARTIPFQRITTTDLEQSIWSTLRVRPRALTTLTLWLNAYGSKQTGWYFHATNILWHLVNALIVMAIGVRLLGPWGGIVAGALCALHPINSQAVTYLAARADVVSTTGVLLALWAALAEWWIVVPFGLLAGLAGKESAIVGLPLVLWVLWRTGRLRIASWMWIAAVPVVIVGASYVWMVLYFGEVFDPLVISRGPVAFAGVQLLAVTRWLWLIVSLRGFSIDPDFEAWLGRWIVLATIGWCAALALGIYWHRARPWLLTGLGWVLIALIPRFVLPTSEFVTEHQSYLALIGIWFLVGAMYEAVVCQPARVADGARRDDRDRVVDAGDDGRHGLPGGRAASGSATPAYEVTW